MTNLTDSSGAVVKTYSYDAFGVEESIDSSDANPFRYCGEYYDIEIGQIYLRARYYDPAIGRFTQSDPARDGSNWYVYAYNNPLRYFDPLGLAPEDHIEFGENSPIAIELDKLGTQWNQTQNENERERIHQRADLLRNLGRTYLSRGNTDQEKLLKGYNTVIKYENNIKEAAQLYNINPHLIATTLFREVTMSGWDDLQFIETGAAYLGVDTSIGLGQIKVSRATEALDHWMYYYIGDSYRGHGLSPKEFANQLNDPKQNIQYLGMILWDTMYYRGIWEEQDIYTSYNGSEEYGEGSMEYSPYFWIYFS